MTKAKSATTDRDRLILLGLATDHAEATPGCTILTLKQLFALTLGEAQSIYRSVAAGTAASKQTTEDAIDWAVANNAGQGRIQQQFGLTERIARRIAGIAKLKNGIKPRTMFLTGEILELAKAEVIEHPLASCETIAKKHNVSPSALRRHRRTHDVTAKIAAAKVAPQPRQRQGRGNRLYAVLADGSQVDPRKCRSLPDTLTFMGVAV